MKNRAYIIITALGLAALAATFSYVGCGGGGGSSSSSSSSGSSTGKVTISGVLDANTLVGLPLEQNSLFNRFCRLFAPQKAYAVIGSDVNRIIAISSRGNSYTITEAVLSSNSFSLAVDKDKPYLLVLLYNTSIVGVYKVDDATGLDSFPLNSASTNIDLGTVALSGSGTVTGTVSQPVILDSLAITTALASAIGLMDDEMLRLAGSLDVDQNGLLDTLEDKWYPFIVHFEFDPGKFTTIAGSFSDKNAITYTGYGFYMHMNPADLTLDWTTGGTLTSPASINGGNNKPSLGGTVSGNQGSQDFYWNSLGTNPAAPPQGAYVVTMPISGTAGTKTYTFENVKSYGIDSNLYDIFIPSVKLNLDGSNKITTVEIQWWKNISGTGWVQPDEAELNMLLHDMSLETAPSNISVTVSNLNNPGAFTPQMTLTAPAQTLAPSYLRLLYTDKFGYVYAFSWGN